ncbi:hypothetical protein AtDm6_1493 [Acetobacter tropicalis]|uniref:Uncharacterized protein n=1 Tax=Acetobacter tropicalis TaxID=104102 RepID=A0A094ZNL8_9PROT|nr:hypothetical protein AtDm6_1493 [Acetobacter tropicalis]
MLRTNLKRATISQNHSLYQRPYRTPSSLKVGGGELRRAARRTP